MPNAPLPRPLALPGFPEDAEFLRGMKINSVDNMPVLGEASHKLGVRDGEVQVVDGLCQPGTGGMSATYGTVDDLPRHARPGESKDPVWVISKADLRAFGVHRDPESLTHALVGPRSPIGMSEFRELISSTRASWRIHL